MPFKRTLIVSNNVTSFNSLFEMPVPQDGREDGADISFNSLFEMRVSNGGFYAGVRRLCLSILYLRCKSTQ